jgi:SAM-dependent methyltransferase
LSGVAPDGSPLDVYRALPLAGEDELVAGVVPPPASVLDLGSGPGRIANALVRRGYSVVAVDDSKEMLRHVQGAETVLADVASLRLPRRFDCVLLASHFVNDADHERRHAVLETCTVHLMSDGVLIAEAYPEMLDWDAAVGRRSRVGEVVVRVEAASRTGDVVDATIVYELGDRVWRQRFSARMFDEAALRAELSATALHFETWLDRERGWFTARPVPESVS